MKKIITIPDSLLQDLEILTAKAKKGRKRYGLSNYIIEVLQEKVSPKGWAKCTETNNLA